MMKFGFLSTEKFRIHKVILQIKREIFGGVLA